MFEEAQSHDSLIVKIIEFMIIENIERITQDKAEITRLAKRLNKLRTESPFVNSKIFNLDLKLRMQSMKVRIPELQKLVMQYQ